MLIATPHHQTQRLHAQVVKGHRTVCRPQDHPIPDCYQVHVDQTTASY